jgi:GT2 family glycosyltransferase
MKLINNKLKPITITYQGKKHIIYPNNTFDGPIQLTIYGLSLVEEPIIKKITNEYVVSDNFSNLNNINSINKTESYISNYNKLSIPSVAVCILSKNSYDLINDCISSIERFVKYKNIKIYVFDTGTTDVNTLNFYNNKKVNCTFPFDVINVGNYHFSKNYNFGLKEVKSDYFLIQNNDTVALNDYVSSLMKIAIIEKVGACGPRMLYKDGLIQHDGQLLYNHDSKGFCNPGHVNLRVNPKNVSSGIKHVDGITCAGMLIRSSVYWESGGLNESYHDIFQDVELNIKIRMNNYSIICDRNSLIHHYDNTSRNKEWDNNQEKLKLKHLDYSYLFSKYGSSLRYTSINSKKFSIVTLVNNEQQYFDFLNDLKEQDFNMDFEVIALPNFNNEYNGCSNALNIGIELSNSEYVIMCHQDLRVPKDWLTNIFNKIKNFIINDIKFGVLGMAGSWSNNINNDGGGVIYLKGNTLTTEYTEVQCLDELCLIIKNDSNIRFDETNFSGYHCYGSDFCLNYMKNGFKNYAINCECEHLSDGFKNLNNEKHFNDYTLSSFTLFRKWRDIFPYFRNTTARYNKQDNSILFYVADEIIINGKKPLEKLIILQD